MGLKQVLMQQIKGAIYEVKSIVEDFQMQVRGGMMSALELWEKAMVPSLLSGARTWIVATNDEYDRCDKLQKSSGGLCLKCRTPSQKLPNGRKQE